jgi:hypothetical protein
MNRYKFEEGEEAWERGIPLAANPHPQRSGDAAEWRAGWHYAADCAREDRWLPCESDGVSEDERLDDPRHGQADYLNRRFS